MLSAATISKLSIIARANGPSILNMATRAMATKIDDFHRMIALCKANSEVLNRNIQVIDNLIERSQVKGANEIYTKECPITGTTLGRQFRHELDHFEKVALDGLYTVRDSGEHKPIDLHFDVRQRGTIIEKDICEARDQALYIQNIFDGVSTEMSEHPDKCALDGEKRLTANFTLPGVNEKFVEFPLTSTLEREMGFVCHHAIHHNKVIKAMATAGHTGLKLSDLPEDFGTAPTTLVQEVEAHDHAA